MGRIVEDFGPAEKEVRRGLRALILAVSVPSIVSDLSVKVTAAMEEAYDRAHDTYCDFAPHERGLPHPDENPYRRKEDKRV